MRLDYDQQLLSFSFVLLLMNFSIGLTFQEEMLALLRDEETAEDKLIQTDISDEDLERVLDRSDLVVGSSSDDIENMAAAVSIPLKGPGWEVVVPTASGGVLSTLNS
jgi:ATP-dependent DNA helicase